MLLTVPLLCWLARRGFEVERAHQVERRLTQVQVMQRGPQVDHVSLLLTTRLEAVEDVGVEVDAEGAAAAASKPRGVRAGLSATAGEIVGRESGALGYQLVPETMSP